MSRNRKQPLARCYLSGPSRDASLQSPTGLYGAGTTTVTSTRKRRTDLLTYHPLGPAAPFMYTSTEAICLN